MNNKNSKVNKIMYVKGYKGSYSTRVGIPITWLREDLGIVKDEHEHVKIIRDKANNRIIIEKIDDK